ncbi:HtaA domain-containing protein [Kocuria massiliensis]|uniref:HtaA domain-containing protein n=1 Tax=Kocuria massiliensis TaxID=1926282 RepID=UPI000A1CDB19|nr:HtaA domain-containing protein [Kocuria massiliensis]
MASPVSHLKPITLACGAVLLGSLALPAAPALADQVPAPTAPLSVGSGQSNAAAQSLHWGFRPSFISYVGGHRAVGEGVTEHDHVYSFPQESVTGDSHRLEIRGRGFVQFTSHCNAPEDVSSCALNLTFANPKLVIDSNGESTLSFTVTTRNYQSGKTEGPHEVVMAKLGLKGATQSTDAGIVSVKNVEATLTRAGAHAFSDFYNEGAPLAPLSFSYAGQPLDLAASPFLVGASWDSGADVSAVNRVVVLKNTVVHATGQKFGDAPLRLTSVDHQSMQATSSLEVPSSSGFPLAADRAGGVLYAYNSASSAVEKIGLDASGHLTHLGALSALDTAGETPLAMGYNPMNQKVALLSVGPKGAASLFVISQDGTVEKHQLPRPEVVSPRLAELSKNGTTLDSGSYYGDRYTRFARSLVALNDGTFLYAPGSSTYDAEGNVVHRGRLLHFAPGANPVTEVAESTPADDAGVDLRGLTSDGQTILRWNSMYGSYAKTQRLAYDNGAFSVVRPVGAPSGEAGEIAEMFFDGDQVVTVDAMHSQLVWSTPDGQVLSTLSVPNMGKTNRENLVAARLDNGDLIVPTMIEDKEYNSILHLTKVVNQTPAPAPEPEPKPSLEPEVKPTPDAKPTPDITPEPKPEPTPDATPTPTSEPEVKHSTGPTPDATPTPDPKPTPEENPTPSVTPAPEPSPAPAETVVPAVVHSAPTPSPKPPTPAPKNKAPQEEKPAPVNAAVEAPEPAPEPTPNARALAAEKLARTGAASIDMYLATAVAAVVGGILLSHKARYIGRHAKRNNLR